MLLAADDPVLLPDRHLEDCGWPWLRGVLRVLVPRPLTETDWAALLEPVARELLGDPVRRPANGVTGARVRWPSTSLAHVAGPGATMRPGRRWRYRGRPACHPLGLGIGIPGEGQLSGVQLVHVDNDGRAALDRPGQAVIGPHGRGRVRPGAARPGRQRGRRAGRRAGPGRTDTLARRLHGWNGGLPPARAVPMAGRRLKIRASQIRKSILHTLHTYLH